MKHIFVGVNVMDGDLKICTRCKESKIALSDFYMCSGRFRAECKKCVIEKNAVYKKKINALATDEQKQKQKEYLKKYCSSNRDKYRAYAVTFKKRHPGYYERYEQPKK